MPPFNSIIAIFVLTLSLAPGTLQQQEITCSVPGCKTCFVSEECLLCDEAQGFAPEPLNNSC